MTRILTGSDLSAPLAACWRAIARHVSKTGKFPSGDGLATACKCSKSHATDMRRRLVREGYLKRDAGNATAVRWTLLAWPAGVTPRIAEGHVEPCFRRSGEPSKDDIERMLRMKVEHGYSIAEIARATGYSSYRVEIILGTRAKDTKPVSDTPMKRRGCLMCGAGFESEGSWNRICSTCKSTQRWRGGNDLSFDGPRAGRGM